MEANTLLEDIFSFISCIYPFNFQIVSFFPQLYQSNISSATPGSSHAFLLNRNRSGLLLLGLLFWRSGGCGLRSFGIRSGRGSGTATSGKAADSGKNVAQSSAALHAHQITHGHSLRSQGGFTPRENVE